MVMNAYLNKRNEKARWRRIVRRLRVRGIKTLRSWLWDLQMYGMMDKRRGGCGVPDNAGSLHESRRVRRMRERNRKKIVEMKNRWKIKNSRKGSQ